MKQLWIKIDPSLPISAKTELLKSAEGKCSVAILRPEELPLASGLKIRTASTDDRAEIKILQDPSRAYAGKGESALEMVVRDRADEQKALQFAEKGIKFLIVDCPNWKIIPLENLIARSRGKIALIANVSNLTEAKTALQTLELGVEGVAISLKTSREIEDAISLLMKVTEPIRLTKGKVTTVKPLGSGARVCVDTCELMEPGEGLLVGSQSAGLFLVEAEVHTNPHVEPRPFRVNAGPVSSYVLTPGFRTRYLSELKAGEEVLLIKRTGEGRQGHVGRVKIERRPMTLIECDVAGRILSTIVQNAETVRLVTSDSSKSVSDLKAGDEILVRVEEGGRHFGTLVADEMVIER